ncbi:hypothetical protein EVAR_35598_1 [Eumeta japonica]|uniref:Uncharacterized protein n=1 Tax=Eumeta variegata TaxID=151549 RepID=A0A4C1WC62_EUMVA|nr:hypothetical protein EVAR_35598_1 [Eumeta japonica]
MRNNRSGALNRSGGEAAPAAAARSPTRAGLEFKEGCMVQRRMSSHKNMVRHQERPASLAFRCRLQSTGWFGSARYAVEDLVIHHK